MPDIPPIDDAIALWSAPPDERAGRPIVVLLHGYGADENDLFGLVPHLPPDFVYAAVRAPLAPPWPTPGASWYPIEGLDGRSADAITSAATRLVEWVDAVAPGIRVGLLGFSQGGAVALQALRVAPERFDFAVTLAGYVTPGDLPGDTALAARKIPVFWGRGALDEVIPAPLIAHTVEWLPTKVDLSGRVYDGLAHAVSAAELADVRAFLDKRVADG